MTHYVLSVSPVTQYCKIFLAHLLKAELSAQIEHMRSSVVQCLFVGLSVNIGRTDLDGKTCGVSMWSVDSLGD